MDTIQVIGVGAQDSLDLAKSFVADGALETPTMLWDETFETWRAFDVSANSQMVVVSGDLTEVTPLFFGFDENQQAAVLDLVNDL